MRPPSQGRMLMMQLHVLPHTQRWKCLLTFWGRRRRACFTARLPTGKQTDLRPSLPTHLEVVVRRVPDGSDVTRHKAATYYFLDAPFPPVVLPLSQFR